MDCLLDGACVGGGGGGGRGDVAGLPLGIETAARLVLLSDVADAGSLLKNEARLLSGD